MKDIFDKLGADIKASIVETCAKVAEIRLRPENGELDRGYNRAVRDISAKIRQLNAKG